MINSPQITILTKILGCSPDEIIRYSPTVYKWRSVTYEVVGSRSKTAPSSHYNHIKMGSKTFYIRELGDKSEIIRRMKNVTRLSGENSRENDLVKKPRRK